MEDEFKKKILVLVGEKTGFESILREVRRGGGGNIYLYILFYLIQQITENQKCFLTFWSWIGVQIKSYFSLCEILELVYALALCVNY